MHKNLLATLLLTSFAITPILAAGEVNLYSARKENLIKPLLDKFTIQTGIKVNLVTSKADALLKRLVAEGKNSPADLLITIDAGRLYRAKSSGVLQVVNSKILTKYIPAHLRDNDNQWFGLSQRARPIFYVKTKVNADQLTSYEDLATAKWQGRICIRSSSNIYNQSLVAAMIYHHGASKTLAWAKNFVNNLAIPPRGGDRDQIKAAAAGMCDLAIANTYYFGKMLHTKNVNKIANKLAVFWPNQQGRGVHINVSGVALTTSSKNPANAIKLMEFLVSKEAQQWYSKANFEYPVRLGVKWHPTLTAWGKFKADNIKLSNLGKLNAAAVKIMDKAGWK